MVPSKAPSSMEIKLSNSAWECIASGDDDDDDEPMLHDDDDDNSS